MPPILTPEMGNSGGDSKGDFRSVNYDYKYPHELNLKPGTVLHDKLKDEILRRARASHAVVSKRYDSWDDINSMLTAYIPLSDVEEKRKKKDVTKPVSVVIPLAYAMKETLLTYQMTALLDRPIFRYEGVGPEDVVGAILLEKIIDVHCQKSKVGLPLHTSWGDAISYGLGVVSPYWNVGMGRKTTWETVREWSEEGDPTDTQQRSAQDVITYEANALHSIDPYMYFPDPNVAAQDIQRAEFVIWGRRDNFPALFSQELTAQSNAGATDTSKIFNVQYLKHVSGGKSALFTTDQSARDKFGQDWMRDDRAAHPVDLLYIHWHLIPKDHQLGTSEKPEKWTFTLAADEIIIAADRADLNHNMFPVGVCAPDYDGYSVTPISKLEVIYGQQELTNWLVNSHISSVMKIIKNRIVYDPSVVNPWDVEDDEGDNPHVRARRQAFGKTLKEHIFQLPLQDVTRGNLVDLGVIMDLANQGIGTSGSVRGEMRHTSERRSATEARGARTSALSRLEKAARITGIQQMQDIAYMFAKNAQQLMNKDVYVKATGQWEEVLRQTHRVEGDRIRISPRDLDIDYDIVSHDATVPSGENLEVMTMIWQGMLQYPRKYDHIRWFQNIAREMGIKNLYQFEKKPEQQMNMQIQPTEQVMDQVQAGDMVPAGMGAGI